MNLIQTREIFETRLSENRREREKERELALPLKGELAVDY